MKIQLKYIPFEKFKLTCSETIDNCLYVVYYSNSFEDAIRNIIYMGGDTVTNACIVGSMAEAVYGISDELIYKANKLLPEEYLEVLSK